MRLFHFSENAHIDFFEPRSVSVPTTRPTGLEWLNGPLVWAIDETHCPLYLFPRECPRILIWQTKHTTTDDKTIWWMGSKARMIAYIERSWLHKFETGHLHCYEFSTDQFEELHDAGMWVSRAKVVPIGKTTLNNLRYELDVRNVELRTVDRLASLKHVWSTTLHASGIRLRNAADWA